MNHSHSTSTQGVLPWESIISESHDPSDCTERHRQKKTKENASFKMKEKTPLKAIRARCKDCAGGEAKHVRRCQHAECEFYMMRFGVGTRTTLPPIREHCLVCCNRQKEEVKLCPAVRCPIWEYRFGKRPKKSPPLPEILTTEALLEPVLGYEG